jgi:hypothetical protein
MVKWPVLALCLSSWTVEAQDPAIEHVLSVHLSIDQRGNLSEGQLTLAVDQIRQIWGRAGVSITAGRYGDPSPSGATRISLRMVSDKVQLGGENPVLAWTGVTLDGQPAPVVLVSVPAVAEFLSGAAVHGRPLNERPQALQDHLLGQAIGRVTAHELGHYLLRRGGHAETGLMRPHYSATHLIEPWLNRFRVADADTEALRREVTRLARLQADAPAKTIR